MREALLAACDFDWSTIDVSVFGSLFQLVKSKEARRSDGEHYTSKANIMKTIGPLFLDELRAEADKLVSSPSTSVAALERFRDSLSELVFADMACGSGNFLLLAYRELRRIETDIIVAIRQRRGETGMSLNIEWEQKLSIGQFYGIELNWWPAKIAETAMFLVDHQANKELANAVGRPPERLPIKITAHIVHGNALQLDWADILSASAAKTYIFGNPPFWGMRRELLNKLKNSETCGALRTFHAWTTSPAGMQSAWISLSPERVVLRLSPPIQLLKVIKFHGYLGLSSKQGGVFVSLTARLRGTLKHPVKLLFTASLLASIRRVNHVHVCGIIPM